MMRIRLLVEAMLLASLFSGWRPACASDAREDSSPIQNETVSRASVILLVHGITTDTADPWDAWGKLQSDGNWSGMVGALEARGRRFGGVICLRSDRRTLPKALDTAGVKGDPRTADFFALEFTPSSVVDGLAAKANELQSCVAILREYCRAGKVTIVAHSAGGLVARQYMQNAIVGCEYRHA